MQYREIQLDKLRKFRYDYNAVADIEERAGMGLPAMLNAQQIGFNVIRLLVWGGLKWDDKGLTIQRAGNMLQTFLTNGGDLAEVLENVRALLVEAKLLSEVEDDEGNSEGTVH